MLQNRKSIIAFILSISILIIGNFTYNFTCSLISDISIEKSIECKNVYLNSRQVYDSLHGYVLNKTGHPIADAKLTLYNESSCIETMTNEIGVYIFTSLFGSNYTIVVSAEGMITQVHSGLGPYNKNINFTLLPFLEVTYPKDGNIVNSLSINVTGIVESNAYLVVYPDNNIEKKVELIAGLGFAGASSFSAWINITQSTSLITVIASNASGFIQTKEIPISVAKPKVILQYPSPTQTTTITASPLVIRGYASDSDGGTNLQLSIKINSGSWQNINIANDGSFAYSIDFDANDNGKYFATLKAVDYKGLVCELSFNYTLSWKQIVNFQVLNSESQAKPRYLSTPSETVYSLSIKNLGNAEDNFTADVKLDSGKKEWSVKTQNAKSVKVGELGTLLVTIKIPKLTSNEVRNGTINVTSEHDSEKWHILKITIFASGIKEETQDNSPLIVIGLIVAFLILAIFIIFFLKHKLKQQPTQINQNSGKRFQ
ncbi:MAG: carboxypeptidase regulatory-like domain-containing protein [Thermoplasmata archaeon]